MSRMRHWALGAILLLCGTAFAAGEAGLTASCDACHGKDGVSTRQNVPTIAGISDPVQLDALKAFRAKTRPCRKVSVHGETGDMCSVAAGLSEAPMMSLAEHYSKLPYVKMKQPVDAAEAAAGMAIAQRNCSICHSNGGTNPADDAGLLGGQPLGWLKSVIADAKDGKLPQSDVMRQKTSKLSDADVTALAEYYASL